MFAAPLPHIGLNLGGAKALTAETGAFTLTGQNATLTKSGLGGTDWPAPFPHLSSLLSSRGITAATGTFVLTGKDATLKYGHKLVSAVGSYTLTGIDATLTKASSTTGTEFPAPLPHMSSLFGGVATDKYVIAEAGSFVVTGVAAALNRGVALTAETGSFTVTGAPAERDMQVTAAVGSFAVSGQDASLRRSYTPLAAVAGAYTLIGRDAFLRYEQPGFYLLGGLRGDFIVSGQDAAFSTSPRVQADVGAFIVTGQQADLRYSGEKKYGKSRKKKTYERKYVVEVDGEEFIVESEAEARDLLAAAVETAKEVVSQVRAKPVKAKPPRIRVKGPTGPELDGLVDVVSAARNEIRELYNDLQQLAEISQLLREQDEEEAILALL